MSPVPVIPSHSRLLASPAAAWTVRTRSLHVSGEAALSTVVPVQPSGSELAALQAGVGDSPSLGVLAPNPYPGSPSVAGPSEETARTRAEVDLMVGVAVLAGKGWDASSIPQGALRSNSQMYVQSGSAFQPYQELIRQAQHGFGDEKVPLEDWQKRNAYLWQDIRAILVREADNPVLASFLEHNLEFLEPENLEAYFYDILWQLYQSKDAVGQWSQVELSLRSNKDEDERLFLLQCLVEVLLPQVLGDQRDRLSASRPTQLGSKVLAQGVTQVTSQRQGSFVFRQPVDWASGVSVFPGPVSYSNNAAAVFSFSLNWNGRVSQEQVGILAEGAEGQYRQDPLFDAARASKCAIETAGRLLEHWAAIDPLSSRPELREVYEAGDIAKRVSIENSIRKQRCQEIAAQIQEAIAKSDFAAAGTRLSLRWTFVGADGRTYTTFASNGGARSLVFRRNEQGKWFAVPEVSKPQSSLRSLLGGNSSQPIPAPTKKSAVVTVEVLPGDLVLQANSGVGDNLGRRGLICLLDALWPDGVFDVELLNQQILAATKSVMTSELVESPSSVEKPKALVRRDNISSVSMVPLLDERVAKLLNVFSRRLQVMPFAEEGFLESAEEAFLAADALSRILPPHDRQVLLLAAKAFSSFIDRQVVSHIPGARLEAWRRLVEAQQFFLQPASSRSSDGDKTG